MNKYCSICGKDNKCVAGTKDSFTCWCSKAGGFPEGIFKLVPEELRGKRCICENCLNEYREEGRIKGINTR